MKHHNDVKKLLRGLSLLGISMAFLAGCAPVFSELQSARVVGPGNVEVTPSASWVSVHSEGESEHLQNHYGVQAALGVLSFMDLRARYERIQLGGDITEIFGINVVGFGPKISLVRDYVAFYVPVGFAFGEDIEVSDTWQVHPTLLLTLPISRYFELNTSGKVLIPFIGEQETLVAFNIGPAFSLDLERWAIRPEIGLLYNPGEEGYFMHLSLGFTFSSKKD